MDESRSGANAKATHGARAKLPEMVWGLGLGIVGASAFDGDFGPLFWIGVVLLLIGVSLVVLRSERRQQRP